MLIYIPNLGIYRPTMLIRRATEEDAHCNLSTPEALLMWAGASALLFCIFFAIVGCCTAIVKTCKHCRRRKRKNVQEELGTSNMLPVTATAGPPAVYRLPGVWPAVINSSPDELMIWVDDGKSHDAPEINGQRAVIRFRPNEIKVWANGQCAVIRSRPNEIKVWAHNDKGQVNDEGQTGNLMKRGGNGLSLPRSAVLAG